MKSLICLSFALASAMSVSNAFANTISCYDIFNHETKAPFFTATVVSSNEITNYTTYVASTGKPDGQPTTTIMSGAVNPRSRKYIGWLYFGNLIMEADFAHKANFKAAIVIQNDEREGGTTHLRCTNH